MATVIPDRAEDPFSPDAEPCTLRARSPRGPDFLGQACAGRTGGPRDRFPNSHVGTSWPRAPRRAHRNRVLRARRRRRLKVSEAERKVTPKPGLTETMSLYVQTDASPDPRGESHDRCLQGSTFTMGKFVVGVHLHRVRTISWTMSVVRVRRFSFSFLNQ